MRSRGEKLLTYSRYFNATFPKDHLYAILGIYASSNGHIKATKLVEPDYTDKISVEDVFTEASWICLSESKDLKILSLVEDGSIRTRHGLPWWVPDWDLTPQATPLVDNIHPDPGQRRWNASGELAWNDSIVWRRERPLTTMLDLRPLTSLPAQGVLVDTIAKRAATYEQLQDQHNLQSFVRILQHALNFHHNSHPGGHSPAVAPLEGFWRALIKDTFDGAPAAAAARAAFPLLMAKAFWELDVGAGMAGERYTDPSTVKDPELRGLKRLRADTEALIIELAPRTDPAAAGVSIERPPHLETSPAPGFLPGGIVPPQLKRPWRVLNARRAMHTLVLSWQIRTHTRCEIGHDRRPPECCSSLPGDPRPAADKSAADP